MRLNLYLIAVIGVCIAGPAAAQAYDPNYPVCLEVYGGHRLQLHVAAAVPGDGLGPIGDVLRQSVLQGAGKAAEGQGAAATSTLRLAQFGSD